MRPNQLLHPRRRLSALAQRGLAAVLVAATGFAAQAQSGPRHGDVLTPEDWAALRGGSLTSPGAQGSEIFSSLAPSVVLVINKQKPRGGKSGGNSLGTGSVVSADGLVITNQHVIADADSLHVAMFPAGGRRGLTAEDVFEARLLRFDEVSDLALIRFVKPPPGLRPLPFGSFSALKVGEELHAIGHPLGNTWTYTRGVVSQIRDAYPWTDSTGAKRNAAVIQTQTPISPGNSGGPLINAAGRMVGVNTFGSGDASAQGLNYAVSVSDVEAFLSTSGNRIAQRVSTKKAEAENCADAQPKVLREYRNSTNDQTFRDYDLDCDGKVDITMRIPDRSELAVRYTMDRSGKTAIVLVDLKRAEKIDYSLHDTNGDGVPDSIGIHDNGSFKPSSFVPYTGEASVRAVLQRR